MAERFITLNTLPENLHLEGFPFIISAGRLLSDTATGNTLALLKIKNTGSDTVKALKVRFTCFDTAGRELDVKTEYTYLDLFAKPGENFGDTTPVTLP